MKFEDLEFAVHPLSPLIKRAKVFFKNGYGASVVTGSPFSEGDVSLYEMAVLDKHDAVCYSTAITNDVLVGLTSEEVTELLSRISSLPPAI